MLQRLRGVRTGSGSDSEIRQLRAENRQLSGDNRRLSREVERLEATVTEQQEEIDGLITLGDNLNAQLAELEARLKANSGNFSNPPLSDGPEDPPRQKRKKRKHKRGGQQGHKANTREMVPSDEVDEQVPVKPDRCGHCGRQLSGDDPEPQRHQVIDIPDPRVIITECLLHRLQRSLHVAARLFAPSNEALDAPLSPACYYAWPGPATGPSGAYPGGTSTRKKGTAYQDAP